MLGMRHNGTRGIKENDIKQIHLLTTFLTRKTLELNVDGTVADKPDMLK